MTMTISAMLWKTAHYSSIIAEPCAKALFVCFFVHYTCPPVARAHDGLLIHFIADKLALHAAVEHHNGAVAHADNLWASRKHNDGDARLCELQDNIVDFLLSTYVHALACGVIEHKHLWVCIQPLASTTFLVAARKAADEIFAEPSLMQLFLRSSKSFSIFFECKKPILLSLGHVTAVPFSRIPHIMMMPFSLRLRGITANAGLERLPVVRICTACLLPCRKPRVLRRKPPETAHHFCRRP